MGSNPTSGIILTLSNDEMYFANSSASSLLETATSSRLEMKEVDPIIRPAM